MRDHEFEKLLERLVFGAVERLSGSIGGTGAPGRDEAGGVVDSLTEAVMGITSGLFQISHAIDGLAESIEKSQKESNDDTVKIRL
jgi:hypothetical protein|tara:strand:+ start:852 stop:1106 length:255 start_codon:yes stop_codon:yes gene_type:complete